MRKRPGLTAALVIFMLASPAAGQYGSACGDRDSIIKRLAQKWQESLVAQALTNRGPLLELLRTSDGSTWTLIISQANGVSCVIMAGEDWRPVKPKPEGTPL